MIRSSTILQHIKSAPLPIPKGALFVCLLKDSPTRHELLSRIVILSGEKRGGKAATIQAFPAWGKGTASAMDRVLSLAVQMHLSFSCTTNCLSYHSHPIRPCRAPSPRGEGGPRQRWIGCFRKQHKCASLFPILSSVFHAIVTLSAPTGHLPLEGKAAIREYHLLNRRHSTLVNLSAPQAPSSRAQPRDLYCTAAICTHAPSLKRHLGASFFAFPSPTIYRSARRIPPLRSG